MTWPTAAVVLGVLATIVALAYSPMAWLIFAVVLLILVVGV